MKIRNIFLLAAIIAFSAVLTLTTSIIGNAQAEDGEQSDSQPEPTSTPEPTSPPDLPSLTRVSEVQPQGRTVTVTTGDEVRLSLNVLGPQGIALNSGVKVSWSSSDGTFSDGTLPSTTFRTPTLPGTYTVTAVVDPKHCDEAADCTTTFTVTVRPQRIGTQSLEQPTLVNPDGLIPTTLSDSNGRGHAVATPVEGGRFQGAGWWLTIPAGAVHNGTLIAARMDVAGPANNQHQPLHRYTLAGNFYDVTALVEEGAEPSTVRLNGPADVCVPFPPQFTASISDVALTSWTDDRSLTVLSTKATTATDGSLVVCGAVSVFPARLAVGVRGAPISTNGVAVNPSEISEKLPDTGGSEPGNANVMLTLVLGLGLLGIGAIATMVPRRRRVGVDQPSENTDSSASESS